MSNKQKTDPKSFFFKNNKFFFSWGVISLRRKMTHGHYSAGVIILLYPAVIRTTTDTIHLSIGREFSGLSASTSGPWDLTRTTPLLLGRGVSTGVPGGGEDTGESDKGG